MRVAALAAALLSWLGGTASGQSPLDRRITVRVRDVSLRDALDLVAARGGIRISYSGEALPLHRRVSLARDSATVDAVLAELLQGLFVQPVVVGADIVVLAPRRRQPGDSVARAPPVLDRVVVTGSVIAASERPLPVALDVVRGRDAEHRADRTLSSVLDGAVPGVWLWTQSPSAMMARYGSIRGASSFGLSYPKVYVDGVEVANPLLLTRITPELVDRLEVIRGPQGAALYGSDAISGVVNVVSRYDGARGDGTHALLRSEAGYARSAYTRNAVPVQEHAFMLRLGSSLRSGGITVGASTSGGYVPRAYSRELQTMVDTRVIGATSTFTAHARFYAKDAGVPPNPLLVTMSADRFAADSAPQQLRTYGAGSTLTVAPSERWTYTMTAGVDGYRLSNVSNDMAPIPSAVDTALRDASGSAVRASVRASSVTYIGDPERTGATVTLAAEHSLLRDRTAAEIAGLPVVDTSAPPRWIVGWGRNTGITAQVAAAIAGAAYVSVGLRGENIGDTRGPSQNAALPMLGAAYVRDAGPFTVKVRAAYGKGIRTPRTAAHILTNDSRYTIANPNLAPETQAGTEAGFDLLLGRKFSLHVTRFDQLASGLIQTTVTLLDSSGRGSGSAKTPEYGYQLQNVGEISNRGWEGQTSFNLRPLSLSAAGTLVSSRVRRTAPSYTGDLGAGDRMLGVPSRTLSATVAWNRAPLRLASTVARAWDWINYDRLSIARELIASGGSARYLAGAKLRGYWARYPGATRLRASAAYDFWRGTTLTLVGENLLNYQRGEPDSITIIPGRTIRIGLRARF